MTNEDFLKALEKAKDFDFDNYFKHQKPVQRIAETPPLKISASSEAIQRQKREREQYRPTRQLPYIGCWAERKLLARQENDI